MMNKTVESCTEALRALNDLPDRIVVVAGPWGSSLSTAILQAYRTCRVHDGDLTGGEMLLMCSEMTSQDVLLAEATRMSMLAIRQLLTMEAPFRIIFRTGPYVTSELAHLPRITLTRIAP